MYPSNANTYYPHTSTVHQSLCFNISQLGQQLKLRHACRGILGSGLRKRAVDDLTIELHQYIFQINVILPFYIGRSLRYILPMAPNPHLLEKQCCYLPAHRYSEAMIGTYIVFLDHAQNLFTDSCSARQFPCCIFSTIRLLQNPNERPDFARL